MVSLIYNTILLIMEKVAKTKRKQGKYISQ
jgi:hypothetical protein